MKMRSGICRGLAALALMGTLLIGARNAQAQRPGGGMPPGMMQKMKAWQKWNDSHKKLTLLNDEVFQVEKMNAEPAYALSKGQAVKMLQILNPWRLRPSMTEEQASALNKQISNVLTMKQVKRMKQIEAPSARMRNRGFGGGRPDGDRRPGSGRPEGGGRPSGGASGGRAGGPSPNGGTGGRRPGGPPPGGRGFPDPPRAGWNPLNAASAPFPQARPETKRRADAFFAALQHKAHS